MLRSQIASSKAQLFIKGLISNQSVAAMFTTKEVDVSRTVSNAAEHYFQTSKKTVKENITFS